MIERGITYNTLNGGIDDNDAAASPLRYALIKKIVRHRRPIFACMQELKGWDEGDNPRRKDFARFTGLPHVAYGHANKSDCDVAIFSRREILEYEVITDGFYHCAVRALLNGPHGPYEVETAHLVPWNEQQRRQEAALLKKRGLLFMDGNHLSPADHYDEASLRQALDEDENVRIRYGEDELQFAVSADFAEYGLVDMGAVHRAAKPTFPALKGTEPFQYPIRLDYIYAPRHLAPAVKRVRVLDNLLTNYASDHFPTEADIDERELAELHANYVPLSQSASMPLLQTA